MSNSIGNNVFSTLLFKNKKIGAFLSVLVLILSSLIGFPLIKPVFSQAANAPQCSSIPGKWNSGGNPLDLTGNYTMRSGTVVDIVNTGTAFVQNRPTYTANTGVYYTRGGAGGAASNVKSVITLTPTIENRQFGIRFLNANESQKVEFYDGVNKVFLPLPATTGSNPVVTGEIVSQGVVNGGIVAEANFSWNLTANVNKIVITALGTEDDVSFYVNSPCNEAPVAVNDFYSVSLGGNVYIAPLNGDKDPLDEAIKIFALNGVEIIDGIEQIIPVSNGTVTKEPQGAMRFSPTTTGISVFPYTIIDAGGAKANGQESITIYPANPSGNEPLYCDRMYGVFNGGSGDSFTQLRRLNRDGTIDPIITTLTASTRAAALDKVSGKFFYVASADTAFPNTLFYYDSSTGLHVNTNQTFPVTPLTYNIPVTAGGGVTKLNSIITMGITQDGKGYAMDGPGKLYKFSTTPPYTINTNSTAVQDILNNQVQFSSTEKGDMIITNNGNILITGWKLETTTPITYTPYFYRINDPANFPLATLRGKIGTTTFDRIYDAMAFGRDNELYLTEKGGKMFKLDVQNLAVTDIPSDNNGAASLSSCVYPPFIRKITSEKTARNLTDGSAGFAKAGDTIEYKIVSRNSGDIVIGDVEMSDVLPVGVDYILNSTTLNGQPIADRDGLMPFVEAGQVNSQGQIKGSLIVDKTPTVEDNEAVVKFKVKVKSPIPTGVTILSNQASFLGDSGTTAKSDDPTRPGTEDATLTQLDLKTDISITKTVNNSRPNRGDTIVFTLTASNSGDNDAIDVVVDDLLPVGYEFLSSNADVGGYDPVLGKWYIGSLAGKSNAKLDIIATVNQVLIDKTVSPFTSKVATNIATIKTSTFDTNPNNNIASVDIKPFTGDLVMTSTVDIVRPDVGDKVVFVIKIKNNGPDNSTGIIAEVTPPSTTTIINNNTSQGNITPQGPSYVWDVGDIAVGQEATLTYTSTVDSAGKAGIQGKIVQNEVFDSVPENNKTTTEIDPYFAELKLTKAVSNDKPNVGNLITFFVKIDNNGPDTSRNIVIKENMPSGVEFVEYKLPPNLVSTYTVTGANGSGEWKIDSLVSATDDQLNSSKVLQIIGKVVSPIKQINNAEIVKSKTYDPNKLNNKASAFETPKSSDLQVTKTVNNSFPKLNSNITYVIKVKNLGVDTATGIEITDKLPTGIDYISYNSSLGLYDSNTGLWSGIASLPINQEATLTIVAKANKVGTMTNTAAITKVDTNDSNPNNNEASVDVTALSADLAVTKTVSNTTPNLYDTIDYNIAIKNNGPSESRNVTLSDILPVGLELVSFSSPDTAAFYEKTVGKWFNIGTLQVGDIKNLKYKVKVVGTQKSLTNIATVSSDTTDTNPQNDSDNVTIYPIFADLNIKKTVSNGTPFVNQEVEFKIVVNNAGNNDAKNTIVTDILPAGAEFVSSTLPAEFNQIIGQWVLLQPLKVNETRELIIRVKITNPNKITNKANIKSDLVDPNLIDNDSEIDVDAVDNEIVMRKSVSNTKPAFNSNVTYTLEVENLGLDTVPVVSVKDVLPAGTQFVSSSSTDYDPANGIWSLKNIIGKTKQTLNIVAKVIGTDPNITNCADAGIIQGDTNVDNNKACATISPEITNILVTKAAKATAVNIGSNGTFVITVKNDGKQTARNVVVTDPTPTNATYVSSTNNNYNPTSGELVIGDLAAGAEVSFEITYTVSKTGSIKNVVVVKTDTPETNLNDNTATATIDPIGADLEVIKTVSNANPNLYSDVTYTLQIKNNGPSTAENVTVNDALPAGIEYITSSAGVGTYNNSTHIWTVGSMANGATAILTINSKVNTLIKAENTAEVKSTTFDFNTGNNKSTATIDPVYADLEVIKTVDNANPAFGTIVNYSIAFKNKGPKDATDVVVTDALPIGMTALSSTSTIGTVTAGNDILSIPLLKAGESGTWTIKVQLDLNTDAQTNIAKINSKNTPDNNLSNNESKAIVDPLATDLVVTKVATNKNPKVGEEFTFDIVATNNGPDAAKDVVLKDNISADFKIVDLNVNAIGVTTTRVNNSIEIKKEYMAVNETFIIKVKVIAINYVSSIDNIVTFDTTTPDKDRTNNTAKETVFPKFTELKLSKTVNNQSPQQNGEVEYTIKIEVLGQTAENLKVVDSLPGDVQFISSNTVTGTYANGIWSLGNANVGVYTLTIKAKALGTVSTRNTVTPTTDTPQKTPETPKFVDIDPNGAPDAKDDNGITKATEPITMQIVKGNGSVTPNTTDNSVTDTDPDNDPLIITQINGKDVKPNDVITLPDGSKITISNDAKSVIVTPSSPTAKDPIKFNYTISDSKGGTDTANVVVVLTPLEADIIATKTVSNPKPQVGEEVTFTLVAFNDGPDMALDVVGDDKLPANFVFVSASSNAYDQATSKWTIGNLASKATSTITIKAKAISSEASENILKLTTTSKDKNPGNNESKVPLDPNGAPIAKDDVGTTKPTLPIIMKIVDGNGIIGTIQKDNSVTDTDPDNDPLIITKINGSPQEANGVVILPSGDKVTIDSTRKIVTVTPKDLQSTTPIKFTYTISDGKGGESTANVTVNLQELSADLKVLKTVNNAAPTPGEFITFTLETTNLGPDTAYTTVLTDALPQGLEFVAVEPNTVTYDTNSKTIKLGDIAKDQVIKVTIMAKVVTNLPVTNVVTVTSATPDPDKTNNTSKVDVDPVSADLSMTKKVSKINTRLGEVIEYTIEVKNSGPDAAVEVVVNESLPVGLEFVSSDTTDYSIATGIWTIGKIEPNQTKTLKLKAKSTVLGNILNTVTIKTPTYDPTPQPPVDETIIVNGDPTAKSDYGTTDPGTQLSMALVFGGNSIFTLAGLSDQSVLDTDPENDNLTIDAIAGTKAVANVAVTLLDGTKVTPDQTLTKVIVTPKDQTSVYQINFDYTVTDSKGGFSTAQVKVDILDANNDTYTVEFNKPLKLDILANDKSSKDQASIKLTEINGITVLANTTIVINGGKLLIGADLSVTFVPNSDFSGATDFTYTIKDSSGNNDIAKVTLNVNNGNPIANNDYGTTDPGSPLEMNIVKGGNFVFTPQGLSDQSKQDTDPNKDLLTIKSIAGISVIAGQTVTLGDNSKVTVDATLTKVTVTSKDNVTVYQINFDYIVTDGKGGDATAKVTVDILDANDDTYSIPSNGKVDLDIFANDKSSKDQASIKLTKINGLAVTPNTTIKITGGTLIIDANGKVSFQAEPGFAGKTTFEYTITDASGNNDTAIVTINVANGAPVAKDDKGRTKPADAIVMKLVDGGNGVESPIKQTDNSVADIDPENDPLVITAINDLPIVSGQTITLPDGSKVTLNTDQKSVTVKSKTDDSKDNITFNYTIQDQSKQTAKANVIVELIEPIADINLTKTVNNSTPQVGEVIDYTITIKNIGPDTAKNVIVLESLPAGLTFISSNATNYNLLTGLWSIGDVKKDEIVTLVLKAKATISTKIINQVTVTTTTKDPTPNPPVLVPIDPNEPPVAKDDYGTTDPKAPLTMQLVNGGTKLYTIDGLSDQSIKDTDSDGDDITISSIDGKPVTPNAIITLADSTTVQLSSDSKSVVVISKDSTSVYTIKFPYTITDSKGGTGTANVVVEMLDANDDIKSTVTNIPVTFNILDNDNNSNGSPKVITSIDGKAANPGEIIKVDHGTISFTKEGNVTFTPDKDYTGPAKFTYSIKDSSGNVDTATVNIVMTNTAPKANDDKGRTKPVDPIIMKLVTGGNGIVQANKQIDNSVADIDPENDNLTISVIDSKNVVAGQTITLADGSKVQLNSDLKSVTVTNKDNTSLDTIQFTYSIIDGKGGVATAKVTVELIPLEADIRLAKTVNNSTPQAGEVIEFKVSVNNIGPDTSYGVIVTDQLPADLEYSSDDSKGTYNKVTGVWTVGDIINGETKTLALKTKAIGSKPTKNVASVTVKTPDPTPNPPVEVPIVPNSNPIAKDDYGITYANLSIQMAIVEGGSDKANLLGQFDNSVKDTDIDGDNLTISKVDGKTIKPLEVITLPNGATVKLLPDSKTVFITAANATTTKDFTFPYEVTDKKGGFATAKVTVKILPNALPDVDVTKMNIPKTLMIMANDVATDPHITKFGDKKVVIPDKDGKLPTVIPDEKPTPKECEGKTGFSLILCIIKYTIKPIIGFVPAYADNLRVAVDIPTNIVVVANGKATANNDGSITVTPDSGFTGKITFTYDIVDSDGDITASTVTITIPDPIADVLLTKTVNNNKPQVGEVIDYTVSVTNRGPDTSVGVEVLDKLPAELEYVSDNGAGKYNKSTGVWTVGDMIKGATATIIIKAKALVSTEIINIATVTTKTQDPTPNPPVEVPIDPNGKPDAIDDTGMTKPTDKIIMKIIAGGSGVVAANKQVDNSIADIDPDLDPVDDLTITHIDGKPVVAGQLIVLADGSKVTLNADLKTVTVEAKDAYSTNPIKFPYSITDGNGGFDTANVTVTLIPLEADIVAGKTVSNPTPKVGEEVTFTLTATNSGPDTALAVEGKDLFPTNFNNYQSTASNFNVKTGVWSIGDLAKGQVATITVKATATIAEKSENVLSLQTKSNDKNPGNNITKVPLDPYIPVPPKSADVAIIKTVMPKGEIKLGDIIEYTLTVTNNGPDVAEAVIATDILPAELEYVSHLTATGTYIKSTGIWSLGDIKGLATETLTIKAKTLKAGNVTNQAEVTSKTPDPKPENNKTKVTVPVLAPPITIRTGANPTYIISYVAGLLAFLAALVLLIRTRKTKN